MKRKTRLLQLFLRFAWRLAVPTCRLPQAGYLRRDTEGVSILGFRVTTIIAQLVFRVLQELGSASLRVDG